LDLRSATDRNGAKRKAIVFRLASSENIEVAETVGESHLLHHWQICGSVHRRAAPNATTLGGRDSPDHERPLGGESEVVRKSVGPEGSCRFKSGRTHHCYGVTQRRLWRAHRAEPDGEDCQPKEASTDQSLSNIVITIITFWFGNQPFGEATLILNKINESFAALYDRIGSIVGTRWKRGAWIVRRQLSKRFLDRLWAIPVRKEIGVSEFITPWDMTRLTVC